MEKAMRSGRAYSIPGGILYGLGMGMGMTLLGVMVLAWAVDREMIPWEQVGYGIMVLLLMVSFLGAMVTYGKIKRQRLMVCGLFGGVYFATLLALTALFFGGQYDGVLVTGLLIAGGSCTAGIVGLRQGRGGAYPKRRKTHR